MSEDSIIVGEWKVEPTLNRLISESETKTLVPKVMSLLMCLARHAGQPVSQEKIFAEVWPSQVVADSSLYQAVAQLRKALGDEGKTKRYIERVSGKGYRLVAEVKEYSHKPSVAVRLTQKFLLPLFILLMAAVVFSFWMSSKEGSENLENATNGQAFSIEQIDSVAFLKLSIENPESAKSKQLSALNDVLLTQLMHIGGMRVLSMQQPDANVDTMAILKGKISQQEGKVRVYLQLERVDNYEVIWAKFFEGSIDDLFGLQDLVTADLLQLFGKPQATVTFSETSVDSRTFDQYLLARHFWEQRNPESLARSKAILEQLQMSDQLFPLAAVALCETYHFLYLYSDWDLQKASRQCEPLLKKVLAVQPKLGQALAAKALLLSSEGDRESAQELFSRAVELSPNYALGFNWYGNLVRDMGQYNKALDLTLKAYRLAPMSPIVNRSLAYSYLNLRQVENADYYYQRAIAMEPGYFNRAVSDLDFYPLNSERAIKFLNWAQQNPRALERQPNFRLTQAQVWLALGELSKVGVTLADFDEEQRNPSFALYVKASLRVAMADYSAAVELLHKRRQLHTDKKRFDMPYVEALIFNDQHKLALQVFLESFPEFTSPTVKVDSSNVYLAMFYLQLLSKVDGLHGWNSILESVDRQIADKEYPNNFYVAEWLVFRGQLNTAKRIVLQLMEQGWLPDTNAETFIYPKMQRLASKLGMGENEFRLLLSANIKRVQDAVKLESNVQ